MGKSSEMRGPGKHGESFWKEAEGENNFGLKMMSRMGWEKGQSLGKNATAASQYVKATMKKDNAGIGCKSTTTDESWLATNDLYANLLSRLNQEAVVTAKDASVDLESKKEEDNTSGAVAMEKFLAGRRLYTKFHRGKDVSNFSQNHLSEIFGRKSSPTPQSSPSSSPQPLADSNIVTTTSSTNISDYFKKKSAQTASVVTTSSSSKPRRPAFDEQFQVDYYNAMMDISVQGRTGLGFSSSAKGSKSFGSDEPSDDLSWTRAKTPAVSVSTSSSSAQCDSPTETEEAARKREKKERKRLARLQREQEAAVAVEPEPEVDAPSSTDEAEQKRKRKEARRLRKLAEQQQQAIADSVSDDILQDESSAHRKKKRKSRDNCTTEVETTSSSKKATKVDDSLADQPPVDLPKKHKKSKKPSSDESDSTSSSNKSKSRHTTGSS